MYDIPGIFEINMGSTTSTRWSCVTTALGMDMSWKLWMYKSWSHGKSTHLLSPELFHVTANKKGTESDSVGMWP